MVSYESQIELGKKYRDTDTGFEGTASSVHFYEHACERVNLKTLSEGKVIECSFDAPELESVDTGKKVETKRPGGPHDRQPPPRR